MAVTEWRPSFLGRLLTGSIDWRLRLDGSELTLTVAGRTHRVNVEEETAYRIQRGTLWTGITFYSEHWRTIKGDGLPNTEGAALTRALNAVLIEKRLREELELLDDQHRMIDRWLEYKTSQEQACSQRRRWFTHELPASVISTRPTMDAEAIRDRLKEPAVAMRLGPKAHALEQFLSAWEADPRPAWASFNAAHTECELKARKDLLDQVESVDFRREVTLGFH